MESLIFVPFCGLQLYRHETDHLVDFLIRGLEFLYMLDEPCPTNRVMQH